MAKYRHVYTSFWDDQNVMENFTPEDKYFYLYLLTNSSTQQIGVYRLPKKLISFEMGYSIESVKSLLDRFVNYHKLIKYNEESSEIAIKNWGKYNLINSGKPTLDLLRKEIVTIKDISLLQYVAESINNEVIKNLFITYIVSKIPKESIYISNPKDEPKVDGAYDHTSTARGQKENEKENKKENINNNICASEDQNAADYDANNCSTETLSDDKSSDTDKSNVPYKEIIELFNNTCKSLPKVKARTKQRDKMIKSLWLRSGRDLLNIDKYFKKSELSDFLTGRSGIWMNCNFDWLLKESNFIKVQEGNYDNKNSPSNYASSSKGNFNNFEQRTYDYSSLEEELLEASRRKSWQ